MTETTHPYKLSVVVLVYNTEDYLEECLDSLVNQTLPDIEIILMDDSSSDRSGEICDAYAEKYANITVVHQENTGGATAGNRGMRLAKGEFIALVDSDDIVPLDAYEKLYRLAKEKDSEIVIGKPLILSKGVLKEILYKYEKEVYVESKTVEGVQSFCDIFYDGFYWNKIFNREFVLKNEIFMPDGMLYADRPMVHKGYLLANRISITTEPVYYWRKRGSNIVNKSITQLKTSLDNFLDRMESINYQINYFKQLADETMLNEFLHRNIDRLFFPIVQIRFDKVFRDIYLKETRRILSLIKDVHDNKLGITKNLYIKFILEENEDALLYLLTYPLKGKVIVSEGAYFWQTQFETHERFQVPLNFFELKEFNADMVKIAKAEVNVGKLAFHNVSIVPIKKISKVTLLIAERKDGPIIYRKAMTKGKLGYSIEILDKDIQKKFCLGSYDIYIGFWSDGEFIRYRVKKSMIKTYIIDATKSNRYYFTENDLMSWHNVKDKGIEFQALEDRLVVKFKSETKYPYEKFMLIDRRAKTQIDFYYRDGRHELPYSQFGDFTLKHFDVYVQLGREKLRIHKKWLRTKLVNKIFQNNGKIIELYFTPKGNLAITSYTKLVRLMTNMKKQFRKIFSA